MTNRKPIDWEVIEREYRATDTPARKLARDHGIAESAVRDRAKRYGWGRGTPAPITAQPAQTEPRRCAGAQTPRADDGLTERQRAFVREYLVDLNATAAYKRAGYADESAESNACRLMDHDGVKAAIQRAMDDRAARTEVTADRVVRELAKIAFGDPRAVMDWGPDGVTLKSSAELSGDDAAMVAEVSETRTKDGGSIKAKLADKQRALELLGRHLGMFVDRKEITGDAGGPIILTREETDL